MYGNEGYFSLSRQSSFGTPTNSWHYIPIESESVVHNINLLTPSVLQARYDEPAPVTGLQTVEGDMSTEINPIDMRPLFLGILGTYTYSAAQSGYVGLHTFSPRQTRFDSNCALTPFTLNVYRGADEAMQVADTQFNNMEISIAAQGIAKMRVVMIGKVNSLITALTASYHTSGDEYTWDKATITMSGATITDYEDIRISIDNKLEGVSFLDGTKYYGKIMRNGNREIRVSGTIDLPNLNEYDQFAAQSERPLVITLTGTEVRSGYNEYIKIDIPSFRYETFPVNITGPNRLTAGFAGRAVYNVGSLTSIQVTMQNTKISSY